MNTIKVLFRVACSLHELQYFQWSQRYQRVKPLIYEQKRKNANVKHSAIIVPHPLLPYIHIQGIIFIPDYEMGYS